MATPYERGLILLETAGLTMTEAESSRLASVYEQQRAQADSLYAIVTDDSAPDLDYDPTFATATTGATDD